MTFTDLTTEDIKEVIELFKKTNLYRVTTGSLFEKWGITYDKAYLFVTKIVNKYIKRYHHGL